MPETTEWTVLQTVATMEEAELAAGFLRNEGVPCRIGSTHSNEFPLNVGELAEIRLEVPENRRERAARLLAEQE
ncbi:MAG: DUF2007 domain-containing protein, partial [Thermoanaerobaculia bacterium]|nr:DUF2007 domain-containing protein [Thermoanaerobaculia bacterium]